MKVKGIMGTLAILGALTFGGMKAVQEYQHRQNPEYEISSQLDRGATEIFKDLKKEGYLHYEIDGEQLDLSLRGYTCGRYHTAYGDRLRIQINQNLTLESKISRNFWSWNRPSEYPEGRAIKLEVIEVKTPDGSRTYEIKQIPNKAEFQNYYETLIRKIYQEKLK